MIIIVKMKRRGFIMLVLFCLNCREEKCHRCRNRKLALNEREIDIHTARTKKARGGVIGREGKK